MDKIKISKVANEILSRDVLGEDPVFSQKKPLNKVAKNLDKQKKRRVDDDRLKGICLKPAMADQKEKCLKQSATKGVVKFFNLITNYQESLKSKTNRAENCQSITDVGVGKRKVKNEESKIKAGRFGAVVGMHMER
ncbi:hypothetical protein OIY81_2294 [Cryptosporidium canis]|nr:hypothetical protein OIY81_2294 [Cryptosporidium canis]